MAKYTDWSTGSMPTALTGELCSVEVWVHTGAPVYPFNRTTWRVKKVPPETPTTTSFVTAALTGAHTATAEITKLDRSRVASLGVSVVEFQRLVEFLAV